MFKQIITHLFSTVSITILTDGKELKSFFIMRKLLIISVSFVLFSLGSCTQETLVAPDYQVSQAAPNNTLTILENDEISLSNSSQNFTIQVNVGDVTISTANNELTIEFTANYDFSNVIPESTQIICS